MVSVCLLTQKLFKTSLETNCNLKKAPFSSLTPVSSRLKNNQQLTVFFPLIELFDFCCRVSSMTKDGSVRILKYSFGYLKNKIDFGFSKKSILFACYIQELPNHVHCTWLTKSINKLVEGRVKSIIETNL